MRRGAPLRPRCPQTIQSSSPWLPPAFVKEANCNARAVGPRREGTRQIGGLGPRAPGSIARMDVLCAALYGGCAAAVSGLRGLGSGTGTGTGTLTGESEETIRGVGGQ